MTDPNAQLRDALARVRRTTVDVLSSQPKTAKAAASILRDLDTIERSVRAVTEDLTIENPRVGKPRKAEVVSHYTIEEMPSHGGNALTEHRTSGAQPFRCPKDVYDAATKVLATAIAPVKFAEVQKGVETRLKRVVPIYQIRLVLRFWSTAGLVHHRRARFVARDATRIEGQAATSFNEVGRRPHVV
jgi:hypothetical protein